MEMNRTQIHLRQCNDCYTEHNRQHNAVAGDEFTMRFTKTTNMNASAQQVWKVFAHDFDDAHLWMASVPKSYAAANGEEFEGAQSAGRVCELDTGGIKASEKFLAYDEAAKTCTIRIEFIGTPGVFPVQHNTVEFSIVDAGEGQSVMTWNFSSKLKPWAFAIWPLIRIGFGVFVGQIIAELKHYVEHGTPHPRKIKANQKALATSA